MGLQRAHSHRCGILIGITVRRRCAPAHRIRLFLVWRALREAASDHYVLYEPGGGLTDTLRHRKCGGSVKQVVLNVSALVLTGITIYPGIDTPEVGLLGY
jgi:hypothetical protein